MSKLSWGRGSNSEKKIKEGFMEEEALKQGFDWWAQFQKVRKKGHGILHWRSCRNKCPRAGVWRPYRRNSKVWQCQKKSTLLNCWRPLYWSSKRPLLYPLTCSATCITCIKKISTSSSETGEQPMPYVISWWYIASFSLPISAWQITRNQRLTHTVSMFLPVENYQLLRDALKLLFQRGAFKGPTQLKLLGWLRCGLSCSREAWESKFCSLTLAMLLRMFIHARDPSWTPWSRCKVKGEAGEAGRDGAWRAWKAMHAIGFGVAAHPGHPLPVFE